MIRTILGLAIRIVRFEFFLQTGGDSNRCQPRTAIQDIYPENLFGLFLTFRVISILQGYFILRDPPKIPCKTSTKLTFLGCFLMVPPRGYLFLRFCDDCALKNVKIEAFFVEDSAL